MKLSNSSLSLSLVYIYIYITIIIITTTTRIIIIIIYIYTYKHIIWHVMLHDSAIKHWDSTEKKNDCFFTPGGSSHSQWINQTVWGGWWFYHVLPIAISGWWYTYPSEKYESQLGWLFPYIMENKIHVPNHQSDFDLFGNELPKCENIPRGSKPLHH